MAVPGRGVQERDKYDTILQRRNRRFLPGDLVRLPVNLATVKA